MDDEELYMARPWAKDSEQKWNLHPLVAMDTDSLSRKVSNKIIANNPPYDDMTFPEDIFMNT
jgi:hypothetical protein